MGLRPAANTAGRNPEADLDAGFWLVVVLAALCLLGVTGLGLTGLLSGGAPGAPSGGPSASGPSPSAPAASIDVAALLDPAIRPAPGIALTDPNGQPVSLASMRAGFVLVFFGYTHCPDVCPATIGTIEQAMAAYGPGVRAVFVTVDPERDTTASLKAYVQFRPSSFTALTGSPSEIRATADAWGVHYARVETSVPGAYSMSHTGDVYVVDPAGQLRAQFPFGTSADAMTATLRTIAAATASALPLPAPAGSPTPISSGAGSAPGSLQVEVASTSVWAGGPSPVILTLTGPAGRINDTAIQPVVQLESTDGTSTGGPVTAVPVRPPGLNTVSYVATVEIPTPGWWRLAVSATPGALALIGSADVAVLDQGSSARIGSSAPTTHSPTLAYRAGDVRALTTDPIPDLRLYQHSTTDALAGHDPFVLVLDSARFRVTTACGKALILARYLEDRWPGVTFIHAEPFRYAVVTDTPVLEGSLADPTLTDVANAWGIGGDPWGPQSMPWVFVVDSHGIVRAKYQGVMGTEDLDVIAALIAQGD